MSLAINKSWQRQSNSFDRVVSNAPNAVFLSLPSLQNSSIINKEFCVPYFSENTSETLIRCCRRIRKVGFVKFSQIS